VGVKIYKVHVASAMELSKAYRSNAGSDAAAERKNAKDAENVFKDDDEVEAEEEEADEEKSKEYGKSLDEVLEPLEKGRKALGIGTIKDWKGGQYIKTANGWVPYRNGKAHEKKEGEKRGRPKGRGNNPKEPKHGAPEDSQAEPEKSDEKKKKLTVGSAADKNKINKQENKPAEEKVMSPDEIATALSGLKRGDMVRVVYDGKTVMKKFGSYDAKANEIRFQQDDQGLLVVRGSHVTSIDAKPSSGPSEKAPAKEAEKEPSKASETKVMTPEAVEEALSKFKRGDMIHVEYNGKSVDREFGSYDQKANEIRFKQDDKGLLVVLGNRVTGISGTKDSKAEEPSKLDSSGLKHGEVSTDKAVREQVASYARLQTKVSEGDKDASLLKIPASEVKAVVNFGGVDLVVMRHFTPAEKGKPAKFHGKLCVVEPVSGLLVFSETSRPADGSGVLTEMEKTPSGVAKQFVDYMNEATDSKRAMEPDRFASIVETRRKEQKAPHAELPA